MCLSEEQKASVVNAQRHQEILLASHKEKLAARYEVCEGPRSEPLNNLLDLDDGGC